LFIFRAWSAEQAWAVARGRVSRRTGGMADGFVVVDEIVVKIVFADWRRRIVAGIAVVDEV
jgi:hypothetical protein